LRCQLTGEMVWKGRFGGVDQVDQVHLKRFISITNEVQPYMRF